MGRLTLSQGGGDPHHVQRYEPCQDSITHSSTAIALMQTHSAANFTPQGASTVKLSFLEAVYPNKNEPNRRCLSSYSVLLSLCRIAPEDLYLDADQFYLSQKRDLSENTLSTFSDSFSNFCIFSLFIVFPETSSSSLGMNSYRTHTYCP